MSRPLVMGGDGLPQQMQAADSVPIPSGGTGGTDAPSARSNLGLGTAATQSIGTSGVTVPLLNAGNTHSGDNIFSGFNRFSGNTRFEGSGIGITGSGAGGEFYQNSGTVYLDGYDRTGGGYAPFRLTGSTFSMYCGGFGAIVCNSSADVNFPNISTTASGANAFLDSAANNRIYRSTSSIRFKREVETVEPQYVDAAMGLRPVWYRSKCEADNPAWGWWGLIAEEAAKIDPRLVHWGYADEDYFTRRKKVRNGKDAEGGPAFKETVTRHLRKGASLKPMGVMYDRLSVLLLAKLQDQEARISAIEAAFQRCECARPAGPADAAEIR